MTDPPEENASTKLSGYMGTEKGEVEPAVGAGFTDEEGAEDATFSKAIDISDSPAPQRSTSNF